MEFGDGGRGRGRGMTKSREEKRTLRKGQRQRGAKGEKTCGDFEQVRGEKIIRQFQISKIPTKMKVSV